MATSTSLVHTQGWYTHHLDVWIISQDVAENKSRIGYRYWVHHERSTNGAWTTLNNCQFTVTIEGQTATNNPDFDFRNNNRDITMMTGEFTVTHDADGDLDVDLYFENETLPGGSFFNASSQSGSFTPTTIPRSSSFTVTPNPVTEDSPIDITITAADPTFTHDIDWLFDGDEGAIETGVSEGTYDFLPDDDWLVGFPRVTFTVRVRTYDGATLLGERSIDVTLRSAPVYPEVGIGTPYDIRFRRTEMDGSDWVVKENIPFLSATTTDTLSASGTCSLVISRDVYDTSLDGAVVVADFFDGAQWLEANQVFFLSRSEDDKADLTRAVTYSGQAYADYILSKGVIWEDNEWANNSPGDILSTYLTQGQSRGWGPNIDWTFSAAVTSANTPWAETTTLSANQDAPLSQILDGFVNDILVEYSSHFDVSLGKAIIDAYNPGYGYDWTVRGADPIVDLSKAALWKVADRAPVRKDFSEKLTRVQVRGDETGLTREAAQNIDPMFGHLEGSVTATGVKDSTRLAQLGDATLTNQATATVERTFTYDLSSTQTPSQLLPYRTFRPGDWVFVPGDTGPERMRVSQVAITRNSENTTATITVGDLIPNGVAATARKLTQAGGGAIAGGNLKTPLGLSNAIPAAPEGLSEALAGYWDDAGQPKSGVNLTWSPVTASLAGTQITVDLYEVWTRAELGTPWTLVTLSGDTEVDITGLEVNRTMDFQVRARSQDGVYGPYSDVLTITTVAPAVDIDGPDLADLYTDGVGTIFAVWGGTLDGSPAPARLAYVTAEVSDDAGATWVTMGTPIVSAGQIVVNPGAWGDFSVRLRGYDRLGNPGDVSDPQDITLTDPYIDPVKPLPPTDLATTPGAAWDASGYLPTAWFDIEWTAPTEDVDGDPVDIAGYDVWGKRTNETELRFLTTSVVTAVRWTVGNGEEWSFQISATSINGGVSDLTDPVVDTADASISVAAAPTAPTLDQYAGLLRIAWAGGGMLPQIKYVYATISTTSGGTYVRAGMPLVGPGEIVVPGLATNQDYYAKIVMVDELGNSSTSAYAGPITLLPITGVTIQTSEVANTGIKMTTGSLTAYDDSGDPTFILNAATGEVWIAPYDAVFDLGASGTVATTGSATTGIAISSDNSSFNTFIHSSGVQIRNDQTPLSWWEADSTDGGLVNFFSPRAVIGTRLRVGDYEFLKEAKATGSRLVIRYVGA